MSVNCFFVFQHGIHCLPCALLPNFVKTAFAPSMTGNAAVLFNQHDHRVAIAIQAQFVYFLRMSGLFALHPLFLSGTAVIVAKPVSTVFAELQHSSRQPSAHGVSANLGQSRKPNLFHQILRHSAVFRLCSTFASFSHIFRRPLDSNHKRTSIPASRMASFASRILASPKWKILAANTASRLSFFNAVHQVLNRTDAAGSNDRNIDRFADRACQRQVETLLGTVPVHAGQQNLARTAPLHFDSPFHSVQTSRITSAVGKDFPTGVFRVDRFGIDSNDNRLRTKKTGRFVDQIRYWLQQPY